MRKTKRSGRMPGRLLFGLPGGRFATRGRLGRRAAFTLLGNRGGDKCGKQRVCVIRLGLEFRMELHRDEPRMVLQFDDLDQIALRVASTDDQPGTLDEIDVGVVDLEAMAVALANGGCLV